MNWMFCFFTFFLSTVDTVDLFEEIVVGQLYIYDITATGFQSHVQEHIDMWPGGTRLMEDCPTNWDTVTPISCLFCKSFQVGQISNLKE